MNTFWIVLVTYLIVGMIISVLWLFMERQIKKLYLSVTESKQLDLIIRIKKLRTFGRKRKFWIFFNNCYKLFSLVAIALLSWLLIEIGVQEGLAVAAAMMIHWTLFVRCFYNDNKYKPDKF